MIKRLKKITKLPILFVKYIQYFVEFLFVSFFFIISRIMPFRFSSFFLGNLIGKLFSLTTISKRISNNLRLIYPLMDEQFVKSMTKKIWVNTARFVAETPHFFCSKFSKFSKIVNIEGDEDLVQSLKSGSAILITSHIGNWWFIGKFLKYKKIETFSIYKKTKNPLTSFVVKAGSMNLIEKHGGEMSKIIKVIKGNGKIFTIFQDHRESNGEILKLMGVDALTSTFFAKIAIKYNLNVFYTSCTRGKLDSVKFSMKFKKIFDPNENSNMDEKTLTQMANDVISKDIDENKEQWFWLHKRWKNNKKT